MLYKILKYLNIKKFDKIMRLSLKQETHIKYDKTYNDIMKKIEQLKIQE